MFQQFANQFVQTFQDRIEKLQVMTRAHMEQQQVHANNNHNQHRREYSFKVFGLVTLYKLVVKFRTAKKLNHLYHGPYIVENIPGPVNYILKRSRGKNITQVATYRE